MTAEAEDLDALPTVAIEQAVRAGVRPTLTEWLALSPEVREYWRLQVERVPLLVVHELLAVAKDVVSSAAIRAAFERAHASEVAAAGREGA